MKSTTLWQALLVACLPLHAVSTAVLQVDPSSQQFIDKSGRVKVYHGEHCDSTTASDITREFIVSVIMALTIINNLASLQG